jgi:hypothetical protein
VSLRIERTFGESKEIYRMRRVAVKSTLGNRAPLLPLASCSKGGLGARSICLSFLLMLCRGWLAAGSLTFSMFIVLGCSGNFLLSLLAAFIHRTVGTKWQFMIKKDNILWNNSLEVSHRAI